MQSREPFDPRPDIFALVTLGVLFIGVLVAIAWAARYGAP